MSACGHDGPEAFDAMVAADDVKGRVPRRRGIHVFARDLEACAGLRCQLHEDGVRYEARFLSVVVDGTHLSAGSTGQCPEVCYGDSIRG